MKAEDVIPRMRALEADSDATPGVSVESVICKLLGLDEEGVTSVLIDERARVIGLWQQHYAQHRVEFTANTAIALGFLQGVTFAVAATQLHAEQADPPD